MSLVVDKLAVLVEVNLSEDSDIRPDLNALLAILKKQRENYQPLSGKPLGKHDGTWIDSYFSDDIFRRSTEYEFRELKKIEELVFTRELSMVQKSSESGENEGEQEHSKGLLPIREKHFRDRMDHIDSFRRK